MKIKYTFPIVALAMLLAGAGCGKGGKINEQSKFTPPTGPVELKIKWTPGERVVQNIDMKAKSETTVPGQPAAGSQNITMGQTLALTVLKATPEGGHELELEFLSARMGIEMGGKNLLSYDSTKTSAGDRTNPVAGIFGKIVGTKLKFFMDASNNVERIEGADQMMSRLSEGGQNQMAASLKSMFSESYFKQMLSSSRFMPPKAVAPGDTWPVQLEFPMDSLGTLVIDFTFTFQSWEMHGKRNCARLEFQGTLQTKPGSAANPPATGGVAVSIKDGTTAGTAWFDPELGITIDTQMTQDMTVITTIPKNPKAKTGPASEPQSISTQMSQVLNIKLDSVN